MNHVIYYFTGTGNSFQIAKDLYAGLEKMSDDNKVSLMKVSGYSGENIECDTLGIVFPVYCGGVPIIIGEFLRHINVSEHTYIYAVADYGAISGLTLQQCSSILAERNMILSGGFLINMPGNYIPGYGAIKGKSQKKMFKNEARRVSEILPLINNKIKKIEHCHYFINHLMTAICYKWMSDIHNSDSAFTVDKEKCTGCGLCETVCSVGNIKLVSGVPVWLHKCEACMGCIQHCPKEAIQAGSNTVGRKRYINPNVSVLEMIK